MPAWTLIAALAMQAPPLKDCGASRHAQEIAETRRVVVATAPLEPYVGEMPTAAGHRECVRFTFSIDSQGRAVDLHVPESSGDFVLVLDARRALSRYRFVPAEAGAGKRHTLVFSVIENRWPCAPPGTTR
jgi:hypothetical protein